MSGSGYSSYVTIVVLNLDYIVAEILSFVFDTVELGRIYTDIRVPFTIKWVADDGRQITGHAAQILDDVR